MDILANLSEALVDVSVGISDNLHSKIAQISTSCCIIRLFFLFIVLRTINLYYQLCSRTVKIYDIWPYNSLLIYLGRVFLQKQIPQFAFLRCHFTP